MDNQSLILAESHFGFHRYAWYYQGEMKALQVSVDGLNDYTGQIHWARVTKVHQGLKGAFVELAENKTAFLPFHLAKTFTPLSEGQYLIVQIIRDSGDGKELRVTTNITLRGLYWVLFPRKAGQLKLSNKIHAKDDIERIINLAESWAEDCGITARTAARSATEDLLENEFKWLLDLWHHLQERVQDLKKTTILVDFAHPLIRLLLEDVEVEPEAIIFNTAETLNDIAGQLEESFHFPNIHLAVGQSEELFKDFDIEDAFWAICPKKVLLKNGSNLIIDETAAATLIDVNAGSQGNLSPRQAQEVNFIACHEIAKQIRLRNLSGQILIDFISTSDKNHKQQLLGRLRQIFKHDAQKPDILGFTRLDILEVTRKRVGRSIAQKLLMQDNDVVFRYGLQRALMLQQLEKELKNNPQAAFCIHAPLQQFKAIKEALKVINPPKIDYVEAETEIKLEVING